jgi:hypothetical protein
MPLLLEKWRMLAASVLETFWCSVTTGSHLLHVQGLDMQHNLWQLWLWYHAPSADCNLVALTL